MLNIAVIGSGYIAQNHFKAIRKIEFAELVCIIDINEETGRKAAKQYECNYYKTLKEALSAEKIDIVEICLPTFLHEQFCLEAAAAKCHVLCEKPVTFTVESFDRMVEACRENGVHFMVGQVARWWPEFITIRDYIKSERLGSIHMIYEKRLCQHPAWTQWHRDPARSGGGLYDLNVHDIDYLYSLFGRPESVYSIGWKSGTGCWNHSCTSLIWSGGIKAIVESSMEMTGNWPFSIEVRITGDKGTLHYSLTAGDNINDAELSGALRWYPADSQEIVHIDVPQNDMFVLELSEFYRSILEEREATVTHAQNRGVLEVIQASLQSLEKNVLVRM